MAYKYTAFFYPPQHLDGYRGRVQVKFRGVHLPHTVTQAGPQPSSSDSVFFLDWPSIPVPPGSSAQPAQWEAPAWPLSNSNFISAWKRRKETYSYSGHNKTPLFYAEAPEMVSALVQLWSTDGRCKGFSLSGVRNVNPLQSPHPRLSCGHPNSSRGAWLTRRRTWALPKRLGRQARVTFN